MGQVSEARVEGYRRALELGADATSDTLRSSYRRLMRRAHPDAGGSEERAKALNEARDYLLEHPERIAPPTTPTATRTAPQPQPRTTPTPRPAPRPAPTKSAPRAVVVPAARPSRFDGIVNAASATLVVGGMAVRWVLIALYYLVIAYFVLLAIAFVGWFITVGLPWVRDVLLPLALPAASSGHL
jgi:hypothetical protein